MSATPKERRSAWSLAILLGVVITITLQIFSGIAMALGWMSMLPFHIEDGMAAALFILLEWLWLAGTRPGRRTLQDLFPTGQRWRTAGRQCQGIFLGRPAPALDTIVEGAFLLIATMAALLGLLLAFSFPSCQPPCAGKPIVATLDHSSPLGSLCCPGPIRGGTEMLKVMVGPFEKRPRFSLRKWFRFPDHDQ